MIAICRAAMLSFPCLVHSGRIVERRRRLSFKRPAECTPSGATVRMRPKLPLRLTPAFHIIVPPNIAVSVNATIASTPKAILRSLVRASYHLKDEAIPKRKIATMTHLIAGAYAEKRS
jgi:hypothetical protein